MENPVMFSGLQLRKEYQTNDGYVRFGNSFMIFHEM